MTTSTLHLDLHPIATQSKKIDTALVHIIDQAVAKKVRRVEIIAGKGSGQLMKRVKKFLAQQHVKVQYTRVEVDAKNHGRLFVYFR